MSSKTPTINFTRTELTVDLVPMIEDHRLSEFGLQFDSKNCYWIYNCPTDQIKFIQVSCNREPEYERLVRMTNMWYNHVELQSFTSYMIE